MLGDWVVKQRTLQRRNRLSPRRQELLQEAFFRWQPAELPSDLFEHPENPEAAEMTRALEEEMKEIRWRPLNERRRYFRNLILTHHPDLSEEEHAEDVIRFLAEAKDWFLGGH